MKFTFVESQRHDYAVWLLCRAMGVSVSGYYRWRKRNQQPTATPRQMANQQLMQAIAQRHQASHGRYGSPRIYAQLRADASFWVAG
jgi:putative transposase